MLYLSTASGDKVREAVRAGLLGLIVTPDSRNTPEPGHPWAADNGCFARAFDLDRWWRWLLRQPRDTCLFATAPDVVGDATATLERSTPWLARIRAEGFPVAFVAQNGQESLPVPWDQFDWLFLGGSAECRPCSYVRPSDAPRMPRGVKPWCPTCYRQLTEWKESGQAYVLARQAIEHGKRVHMGRVNSRRRWRLADRFGCTTVDGTKVAHGPDVNLPIVLSWAAHDEDRSATLALP